MLLRAGQKTLPDPRLEDLQKAYIAELVSSGSDRAFVTIDDCTVPVLFASLYHIYYDHPVIELKLSNLGPVATRPGRAEFFAKAVMDYPTETPVPVLEPFSETTVMLRATFNRNTLTYVEASRLAAVVDLHVGYGADDLVLTQNLTFEMMGRNSIDWEHGEMIASFVTPKDPDIQVFMRQALKMASGQTIQADLDTHLYRAVALYDAIQSVGIYYQPDPRQPFNFSKFTDEGLIDYVQYPRDTLLRQSGDCDDLSVLYASLLESSGIPTVLVTSPGHIFTAFATENGRRTTDALGLSPDLLIEYKGAYYLPVETTLMDSPFVSAWRVAATTIGRYRDEGEIGFIDLEEAWQQYKTVTLPPNEEKIPLPSDRTLGGLLKRELDALNLKQVEKRLAIFKRWLEDDPANLQLLLFLARSYGEVGVFEEARAYAERALKLEPQNAEVHQTLGNLAYMQNEAAEAARHYEKADKLDHNAAIQINLALAYLKDGRLLDARRAYKEAQNLDNSLTASYPELGNLLE